MSIEKHEPRWNLKNHEFEDIFQIAVDIEQGGYDFYSRVVDASDDPRVRNELKYLRDEEAKHKEFFSKQLKKRGVSPDHKIDQKLQRILEEEFLKPIEGLYASKKITKSDEVLKFGVDLEQKTIDLYSSIKENQIDSALIRSLDQIIEEEKKHKRKLNIILAY
jgi:rubrerythrin